MSEYIDRDLALSHPYANGKYDKVHANIAYITGFESYKEWLETLPKADVRENRWIPVYERLPKDGQSVLFCDIDDDIMVGYHVKGRPNTHFTQDGSFEDMKNVRAWQPLPEPYMAESEDKPNE